MTDCNVLRLKTPNQTGKQSNTTFLKDHYWGLFYSAHSFLILIILYTITKIC